MRAKPIKPKVRNSQELRERISKSRKRSVMHDKSNIIIRNTFGMEQRPISEYAWCLEADYPD